ncbi:MAG TPA: histidine kinase dimerization/phosphoacceptor domain -containing protein [Caulobacteraceae bacterium]|nr:histidine kinase dimerization/phosphoacceptor domain -containing protein [Caulobacteraceae bacterium]
MPVVIFNRERLRAYGVGAGCLIIAFVLRSIAGAWFQTHYPYLTYFCAVILTAYLAGLRPALAVGVISATVAILTYSPPISALAEMPSMPLGGAMFLATASACALAIASLRTARDRLEIERRRYADLAENRDVLYRELQHRVSNNIQVVAGLLRLQAASASPSGRKALIEASERISLIAGIQRELHDQAGAPTAFCDFARDLLSDAVRAAGAERVKIVVRGGDQPLHPNQATPVSLVLLECVNNALEHGFADGKAGAIDVALLRQGDQWVLTVQDDGNGPPADFDVERNQSLGLKIVRAMAAQLQGEFSLAKGTSGALCRLSFPALD